MPPMQSCVLWLSVIVPLKEQPMARLPARMSPQIPPMWCAVDTEAIWSEEWMFCRVLPSAQPMAP